MKKYQNLDLPADPSIKNILIIKWSSMGDLVLASAVIEDICSAFPNASFDLNIAPNFQQLYSEDPRFNKLICIDIRKKGQQIKHIRQWLKIFKEKKYDLVIDLQSNDRSRMLMFLLLLSGRAPKYRIGNNSVFPYTIRPKVKHKYALDIYQETIRTAGIPVKTSSPVLHIPQTNKDNAAKLQTRYKLEKGAYAILFPGCQAAGHLRRWGANNYIALANKMLLAGIKNVVLIGGADEADECESITKACDNRVINLCGQTKVLDIVPLCRDAKICVSNDTGTAHIAAATKTQLIVLFGPSNPEKHRPPGEHVITMQASHEQLDCLNCYLKECSHKSCMKLLTPEMVFSNITL